MTEEPICVLAELSDASTARQPQRSRKKKGSRLPRLCPSFTDNGHLRGVKEWVCLSRSQPFHAHAHYLVAHGWQKEKRSIITLRPFHCDLGSYLLYSLSAGRRIIFSCVQKFCSPQAGHALSASQVAFMAACTSPLLSSSGGPVYLVTERKSSCTEQLFNMSNTEHFVLPSFLLSFLSSWSSWWHQGARKKKNFPKCFK